MLRRTEPNGLRTVTEASRGYPPTKEQIVIATILRSVLEDVARLAAF